MDEKIRSKSSIRSKYCIVLFFYIFIFCKSNQKICEGENCRFGKHTISYENGDRFEGEFYEDTKHGFGIYRYSNGDVFEGDYKYGFKEGVGSYTFANGDRFVGNFVKGKREGLGKYYFADGFILEGNWISNELTGKAKIVNAKGSLVLEGYWHQNVFIGINPKEELNDTIKISNPE